MQDRQGQTTAWRRNAELQRDIRPQRSTARFHKVGTPGNQEIASKRDEDGCPHASYPAAPEQSSLKI